MSGESRNETDVSAAKCVQHKGEQARERARERESQQKACADNSLTGARHV